VIDLEVSVGVLSKINGDKIMAKCIECEYYITAKQTGDQPGCSQDGDVTDPNKDINCPEAGDEELNGS